MTCSLLSSLALSLVLIAQEAPPVSFSARVVPRQPTEALRLATYTGNAWGTDEAGIFQYRGRITESSEAFKWKSKEMKLSFADEGAPGGGGPGWGTYIPVLFVGITEEGQTVLMFRDLYRDLELSAIEVADSELPIRGTPLFNGRAVIYEREASLVFYPLDNFCALAQGSVTIQDPNILAISARFMEPTSGRAAVTFGDVLLNGCEDAVPYVLWCEEERGPFLTIPVPDGLYGGSAAAGTIAIDADGGVRPDVIVGWFGRATLGHVRPAAMISHHLYDDQFDSELLPRQATWQTSEATCVKEIKDQLVIGGFAETEDGQQRAVYWVQVEEQWRVFDVTENTTGLGDGEVVSEFGDLILGWASAKTDEAWYVLKVMVN